MFNRDFRCAFGRVIDAFDDSQKLFSFIIYQLYEHSRIIHNAKKYATPETEEKLNDFKFDSLKVKLPENIKEDDLTIVRKWFKCWRLSYAVDVNDEKCADSFIIKAKCNSNLVKVNDDLLIFTVRYINGLKKQPEIECYYSSSLKSRRSRFDYNKITTINGFNNFIGSFSFESKMIDDHRERMQHINPMLSDLHNWIPHIDMSTTQGMLPDEVKAKQEVIENSYTEMLCHYIIACRDKENSKIIGDLNDVDFEVNREYVSYAMSKLKYDSEYSVFRNWKFFGCKEGVYGFEATSELLVILEHRDNKWKMTLQPINMPNTKIPINLCNVISRNTFVQAIVESKMALDGTLNNISES